eukprot:UN29473
MSTRLLTGFFEPTETGGENLNRTAWNRTNERTGSRYPAQVPIRPVFSFSPLNESSFRSMFHDGNRIRKLDEIQVKEILGLFRVQEMKRLGNRKKSATPTVILSTGGQKSNPWKTNRKST